MSRFDKMYEEMFKNNCAEKAQEVRLTADTITMLAQKIVDGITNNTKSVEESQELDAEAEAEVSAEGGE